MGAAGSPRSSRSAGSALGPSRRPAVAALGMGQSRTYEATADAYVGQSLEDQLEVLPRHLHEGDAVAHVDAPDDLAGQPRLAGDGAHDGAGSDAVAAMTIE